MIAAFEGGHDIEHPSVVRAALGTLGFELTLALLFGAKLLLGGPGLLGEAALLQLFCGRWWLRSAARVEDERVGHDNVASPRRFGNVQRLTAPAMHCPTLGSETDDPRTTATGTLPIREMVNCTSTRPPIDGSRTSPWL